MMRGTRQTEIRKASCAGGMSYSFANAHLKTTVLHREEIRHTETCLYSLYSLYSPSRLHLRSIRSNNGIVLATTFDAQPLAKLDHDKKHTRSS